jgi:hypothetical protein
MLKYNFYFRKKANFLKIFQHYMLIKCCNNSLWVAIQNKPHTAARVPPPESCVQSSGSLVPCDRMYLICCMAETSSPARPPYNTPNTGGQPQGPVIRPSAHLVGVTLRGHNGTGHRPYRSGVTRPPSRACLPDSRARTKQNGRDRRRRMNCLALGTHPSLSADRQAPDRDQRSLGLLRARLPDSRATTGGVKDRFGPRRPSRTGSPQNATLVHAPLPLPPQTHRPCPART